MRISNDCVDECIKRTGVQLVRQTTPIGWTDAARRQKVAAHWSPSVKQRMGEHLTRSLPTAFNHHLDRLFAENLKQKVLDAVKHVKVPGGNAGPVRLKLGAIRPLVALP